MLSDRRDVISALPRAVTSRSLTPSMRRLRPRCVELVGGGQLRGVAAPVCAGCCPLPRPAAQRQRRDAEGHGAGELLRVLEFSMIHADVRRDAAQAWIAGELGSGIGAAPLHPRPRVRGRELPPLLPRDARRRPQLHRDGRAARARGLPPVRAAWRACCASRACTCRRCSRRISARVSCCSPIWARAPISTRSTSSNADPLFADATDALVSWQLASAPGVLPPYDEALLRRELELFPEWYLGGTRHRRCPTSQGEALETRLRSCSCRAPSRSRRSTCTATTCRAT